MIRRAVATEVLPGGKIGVTWPCETFDLSRGGVGLFSRRLLPPGASLLLRIEGVSGKLGEPLFGGVMHLSYLTNGEHRLGVEFRPMPQDRTLAEWIERERRRGETVRR
jgi:hypothetical protein